MKAIKNLFNHLFDSFTNSPGGFSARKLSAFVGVIGAMALSFKFTDSENLPEVLAIWLVFSALCMSIITIEEVIRFKEGRTTEVTATTTEKITINEPAA